MQTHILGFPRIGAHRELKKAIEGYWAGKVSKAELESAAAEVRKQNWATQKASGLDYVTVGDFAYYDHMLNIAISLGVIPKRFLDDAPGLDRMFLMARGAEGNRSVAPLEMTKWFDTNYHYLVPELDKTTTFKVDASLYVDAIKEAQALGHTVKVVIPGPVTFLSRSKSVDDSDRFMHCAKVVACYAELLREISQHCKLIQIDEPVLGLDLCDDAKEAFGTAYAVLRQAAPSATLILASYFAPYADNLATAAELPVDVLHLDLCRGAEDFDKALAIAASKSFVLSLGLVNGRNIWKVNAAEAVEKVKKAIEKLGADRVWVGSSCSLLHSPVDLDNETVLDPQIKRWLSFAKQKCAEIRLIADAATGAGGQAVADALKANSEDVASRKTSKLIHNDAVAARLAAITPEMDRRKSPYKDRIDSQRKRLGLGLLPTTTIGSFPQTADIRSARAKFKKKEISEAEYTKAMQQCIADTVKEQEALDIDVLVHGEPERNDMVEYFGEQLEGFCFTANGWVQSYGTRCVKPPVLFGDVSRPHAMTVEWSSYAQSLTKRSMKGMLTGPVTIACWSFVRDDIPQETVLNQLALSIRDEVVDLEKAGIGVIQVDEPALREGLPLRKAHRKEYLRYAVRSFRLATCGVKDDLQIHTHMCYCDFHDIIDDIAAMDADVISLEASRSRMELLSIFKTHSYPNEVGPGVYDIHSPRVPSVEEITELLKAAVAVLPVERVWVNPDCGLKTRAWPETRSSLTNMVTAAKNLRASLKKA